MTGIDDLGTLQIRWLESAAATCRQAAAKHNQRADRLQEITDSERSDARYLQGLAGRWGRVADAVTHGVISFDHVVVSLEHAEQRLAARTADGPLPARELLEGATAQELRPFAVDDVVNVADGTGAIVVNRSGRALRPLEGLRGTVTAVADGLVTIIVDNLGSTLTLPPMQLMHHEDWIALDVEPFGDADAQQPDAEPDVDTLVEILHEGVHDGPVYVQVLRSIDGGPDIPELREAWDTSLVDRLLEWKDAAVRTAVGQAPAAQPVAGAAGVGQAAGFHKTTATILGYVLGEQCRDLNLFQRRLDQAGAGASQSAVTTFRNQIAELTAVVADLNRLVALVEAENDAVEDAKRLAARADVEAEMDRDYAEDVDDLAAIDGVTPMVVEGARDFDPFWSATSESGC